MFLVFLPFFFLPERIWSKVKSLALQLISREERCPCYFHQQWVRVGYGGGEGEAVISVISGDAVHHFVNERLSLAVSVASCL